MKTRPVVLSLMLVLVAAGTTPAWAQSNPQIVIRTEAEVLARGFADAFATIHNTPVYLTYERGGKLWTISSVRSVRAEAGVLIVETDKRLTFVLNPHDVIGISDSPPSD